MALVNICSIVFSKTITDTDIRRVDTNVNKWHTYLKTLVTSKKVKPMVFTISQHYLTHLSLFMRSMGPMSFYSAYAMEHAIGEIKQKIKSRSAPGVNAGNVMYKLAAHRYNERIKNQTSNLSTNNDKQILTTSWNDDDSEIWGPFWAGIISEYARYDFETCLRNYWHIHINDLNDNINSTVEFGSRLWLNERDVTGSSYRNQGGHRRDDFYVKLTIDVDINRRSRIIQRKPRIYFGESIFYFQHTQQTISRLLALVKILEINIDAFGFPYILSTPSSKYVVVSVTDIECLAGLTAINQSRRYVIWNDMHPLKKNLVAPSVTFIDMFIQKKIFTPTFPSLFFLPPVQTI